MSRPLSMNKERYVEILTRSAVQRFGEERARSLEAAIRDIAQSLEKMARQAVADEEEPAFCL